MCIAAGATCPGGASIGCLEGGACPTGSFCCVSLLGGGVDLRPGTALQLRGWGHPVRVIRAVSGQHAQLLPPGADRYLPRSELPLRPGPRPAVSERMS